jgi:(p)ppGpp synthase/HD superfamily hydrolase
MVVPPIDGCLFDGEVVTLCRLLAHWLHRNQTDKQGEPYIIHLQTVAAAVARSPWYVISAAWLHDSVEDGHITIPELRKIVPVAVTDLVSLLTS